MANFKAQGIPDTDHHNFVKAVKAFSRTTTGELGPSIYCMAEQDNFYLWSLTTEFHSCSLAISARKETTHWCDPFEHEFYILAIRLLTSQGYTLPKIWSKVIPSRSQSLDDPYCAGVLVLELLLLGVPLSHEIYGKLGFEDIPFFSNYIDDRHQLHIRYIHLM